MNATHASGISITLQSLLDRCFAKEMAERAREEQEERAALEARIPLFVMSYLLPGTCHLLERRSGVVGHETLRAQRGDAGGSSGPA